MPEHRCIQEGDRVRVVGSFLRGWYRGMKGTVDRVEGEDEGPSFARVYVRPDDDPLLALWFHPEELEVVNPHA